MNFTNMYPENSLCPMCERSLDTQEHLLLCPVLQNILPLRKHVYYKQINGSVDQQETYVKIYKCYLQLRDELMGSSEETSLPGHYTGPVCPQAANRGPAKGCSTITGDG